MKPDLERHLERLNSADWQDRVSAANALGQIGGPLAERALIEALHAEDGAVTRAAADALLQLKSETALLGLLRQFHLADAGTATEIQDALLNMSNSDREWIIGECLRALQEGEDEIIRAAAAEALAFPLQAKEALPALHESADDPSNEVRQSIRWALDWLETATRSE